MVSKLSQVAVHGVGIYLYHVSGCNRKPNNNHKQKKKNFNDGQEST